MTDPAAAGSRRGIPPRLTLPELWASLAVLLPVLGALLASISTVDLAYHVRAGAIILDTRTLPSPDTFTFTAAGSPWLDQQWAAQAAFAAIDRLGGWPLLALVRAALVGVIWWLVFRACRAAGAGTRVAAWLTLGGFAVGLVALGLRPQLLGMVLFAATLAILAGRDRRPGLVWAIPFIVLVWANVHGSFFLGPVAVVIACLEDVVSGRPGGRRLLIVAIASAAATLVNPYGPGVWLYAAGVAADPTIRRLISEWQVTSPLSLTGALFYASIVGSVVLVALSVRRAAGGPGAAARFLRVSWPTLVWLAGLAALGAFAERGVAWWSIAFPIALAVLLRVANPARTGQVESPSPAERPDRPAASLVATAIVAIMIVAILVRPLAWAGGDPLYGPTGLLTDAPRGVTEAVLGEARSTDRIWNAQRWGSWLEFAVPQTPVAVDTRIELIPRDAWDDHLALSGGAPDWSGILDRRGVTLVVASATEQRALIPLLRAASNWRLVHDDVDGAVFARADR